MTRQLSDGPSGVGRPAGRRRAVRTRSVPLVLTLLVLVVPAARGGAADWQQYGNGVGHANYTAANLDPASLRFAWKSPAGFGRPLVAAGSVYAMTYPSGNNGPATFASFDAQTGQTNWSATASYVFPSALAYADGLLAYYADDPNSLSTSRLWVRDAATGAVRYSVSYTRDGSAFDSSTPLLAHDAAGRLIAYFATGDNVHAVLLGATSGTKLWDTAGPGSSISMGQPSIVGNSLVTAEVGRFSAYDLTFGIRNTFHQGNVSGGGNGTPVVDAARGRVYVNADYDGAHGDTITAYHYDGGNAFTRLWQYTGTGVDPSGGMSVDAAGNLFSTDDRGNLVVLGPDGSVLRTMTGQDIATAMAPTLTDNALYVAAGTGVRAYDPATFALLASFDDFRGNNRTIDLKYLGPVTDGMMIVDHIDRTNGFNVYRAVPEPSALSLLAAAAAAAATGLRRRRPR